MRPQNSLLIAVICLLLGFNATISLAQQAPDGFPPGEGGARANLVVTSVSGPTTAIHNQTISVTYKVKNQGRVTSGAYRVDLFLSTDNTINPAADRLLKNVTFSKGLAPGVSKRTTSKVLVPLNGLSGTYYYGAVVGTSKKASSKQVSLVRYSLADDSATVTDHKTGLVWEMAVNGGVRTWAAAEQYCADLVLGGKSDWRLPSIDELETIVDYSRTEPAIDPLFQCRSDYYWSDSTFGDNLASAWGVSFDFGFSYAYTRGTALYVRCVRGGP
jgi:hypothetical protein